ncbi:rhomboid family intramembrane serine protease [Acinetobacter soli]|uniref:rhomboid family intramembrane serine protease n=1 Tax=Acinetobacter soli TaxID=487316 RepID=UPI000CE53412|nr:rhomboid family intramembrane serine protease [Acinetobacter soli]PPB87097.1 rhomboid family intramembrane serine protease [Acinetobacter soli]
MTDLRPPQMNRKLDLYSWWITAVLIMINVGLFVWQIMHGVDASNPTTADAIYWGADFAPLTYLEQPARLFTSMFFHFGLIHLMLNMWALYVFGNIAEQLLGRGYYLSLYILAGLAGSLLSGYITIRDSYALLENFDPSLLPHVGAGASGAVMGLGGALTILAILPALPRQRFILDKKALLIIMAINLAFGFMATGINNAAHIGGMLMGALLALIWYVGQRFSMSAVAKLVGLATGSVLCYLAYQYCLSLLAPILELWQHILMQMKSQLNLKAGPLNQD